MSSMKRRTMLKSTLGALVTAPAIHASDKSGNKLPVLGEGDHTFEVTHDWGQLPADIQYGNTHGVCEDSQGRIYIHHTVYATSEKPDSMVVFDPEGRFVKSWAKSSRAAHMVCTYNGKAQPSTSFCATSVAALSSRQPSMVKRSSLSAIQKNLSLTPSKDPTASLSSTARQI